MDLQSKERVEFVAQLLALQLVNSERLLYLKKTFDF